MFDIFYPYLPRRWTDFEGNNLVTLFSEGTNGFITFTIEGDPAPTVQWFKGFKDLSVEQRFRL